MNEHYIGFNPQSNGRQASLPARIIAFLISAALLVLGVMFSVVALAIAAVIAVALAGWFWWKTRALRKTMRDAASERGQPFAESPGRPASAADPAVIEGEFVRESDDSPGRPR